MGTRSDPLSHTWSLEAVGTILTTSTKMLKCSAQGDFNALLPEDLFCYFSRYYAALLRGGFSEAGNDKITLELCPPQAKWFVTWLYTGRFSEDLDYPSLFQLYIFADRADIPAMRKDIMTHIHKSSHQKDNPPVEDALEAFDNLPKSSGLVRWMVDRFANHGEISTLRDYPEFFSHAYNAVEDCYVYTCSTTACWIPADPCCSVIDSHDCGVWDCRHLEDLVKRGQACAYHEHQSPEQWKACAGEDFEQTVDLIYMKGTTAIDPVLDKRFANFEHPDSMAWTLSDRPEILESPESP